MYGCESWSIKKTEHQRTDAFELWCWRRLLSPLVWKIPWRREWLPTSVFSTGDSHGQRSLVGYSPWGHKESDRTEKLTLSLFRR